MAGNVVPVLHNMTTVDVNLKLIINTYFKLIITMKNLKLHIIKQFHFDYSDSDFGLIFCVRISYFVLISNIYFYFILILSGLILCVDLRFS